MKLILSMVWILWLVNAGDAAGKEDQTPKSRSIQAWIKDLKKPAQDGASPAVRALVASGVVAVPPLIRALEDKRDTVRANACRALGGIGPPAKDAVAALAARLQDTSLEVRQQALEALIGLGASALPALPELAQAAKDPVLQDRALVALGSAARAWPGVVLSTLEKAAASTTASTRAATAEALGWLNPGPSVVLPLLSLSQDRESVVQQRAIRSLAQLGPSMVPGYANLLDQAPPELRRNVVQALALMGPQAKKALPALDRLLQRSEGQDAVEIQQARQSILSESPAPSPSPVVRQRR